MGSAMRVEFGQADLDNALTEMTSEQIDSLAFGAIQLDAAGTVLTFNQTESTLTGRPKDSVIGHNFFQEIAPCCNKPAFRGVFDRGVREGNLNAIFDYVFDYRMSPTRVKVHMKSAMADGSYWVFVKRL